MNKPDKKSTETALRSFMDEQSEFRHEHIKRQLGGGRFSVNSHVATMNKQVRTMEKLWKRFHKAGGVKL